MSTTYTIQPADLSNIYSALKAINSNIVEVNNGLFVINDKQIELEDYLLKLRQDFHDFLREYERTTNLQFAETRIGNLKQELQIKFGYYAEIRRMATGVLQGADVGIVTNKTIQSATEEVMLKAPGYWLAPALVALASWLRNDKNNADKAINESLKRDDYKSTLFFLLINRRMGRDNASIKWLERYFLHQDPTLLDREFITILEGVTTGIFSPSARNIMMDHVQNWINQLSQTDNFIDAQKSRWVKYYLALTPPPDSDKYLLLQQYAKNWAVIEKALQHSKINEIFNQKLSLILSSGADFSETVVKKIDSILNNLVTNFDDEELPLQKEVRLNQLIIDKQGDKNAAQQVLDAEENIYKEHVDLLQLLTNAAFNAEASGATKVTQVLAVSISQPWILESYDTFVSQIRGQFPASIELVIDGFACSTKDGSDEKELTDEMNKYYDQAYEIGLRSFQFPIVELVFGIIVTVFGFMIDVPVGVIALIFAVYFVYAKWSKMNKAREAFKVLFDERRKKGIAVLRGCMAETVDYLFELREEDHKAENLRDLISSISRHSFAGISQNTSRNIIS